MKKTTVLILATAMMNAHAQDVMKTLFESSPTKKSVVANGTPSSTPQEVGSSRTKTSVTGKTCQELNINEQKSVPLKVINSLIQDDPRKISLNHDSKTGILKISSEDMVANCNSMIEWKVNQTQVEGENTYLVEARIKQGADCKDGKCNYRVYKVENKFDITSPTKSYAPNFDGFLACLKDSGAFAGDGGYNQNAIYYAPINERISDIKDTGKVLYVSEGPASSQIGPATSDKFKIISDCKYYEDVSADQGILLSQADEEKKKLREQAAELEKCTVDDYHKVADFISEYTEFEGQLKKVRDDLIMQAAQKSAQAILEGKSTEEDMRVLDDFEKYIIGPKKEQAEALYAQLDGLKGTERDAKLAELTAVLKDLSKYAGKPYFEESHVNKLMTDGKFDQAEKVNDARLIVMETRKLGTVVNGKMVSPEMVASNISDNHDTFAENLDKVKEKYEVRTGQVTGTSKAYKELANRARQHIQIRTQNYMEAIQDEQKRMSPGGYCTAYFRNYQKCAADSMERIQELQVALQKNNLVDQKRAEEFDKKAGEYEGLEAEGKKYLADQGRDVSSEPANTDPDNLKPKADNSSYTFNYNPQQGQQCSTGYAGGQMCFPQQQGYFPQQQGMYPQVMPYQQSMFAGGNPYFPQQNVMGQGGPFGQFGFQANFGSQPYMGLQQPMFGQQMPYNQYAWGQPAMNQYQMPMQNPMMPHY
jgi:hypothetical protein